MSHLETLTHLPTALRPVVEYSPNEYRKLNRQRSLWTVGAMAVSLAQLILVYFVAGQHPALFVAVMVMVWPAWMVIARSSAVSFDFRRDPTVVSQGFVREVRKVLARAARRRTDWSTRSAFTVELSVMKFPQSGHNDMFLRIVSKESPMLMASYRVSPTSVTTKCGPTLQEIFSELKQYLEGSGDIAKIESNIGSKLQSVLPNVDRGQVYSAYGPLDTASPMELMGD